MTKAAARLVGVDLGVAGTGETASIRSGTNRMNARELKRLITAPDRVPPLPTVVRDILRCEDAQQAAEALGLVAGLDTALAKHLIQAGGGGAVRPSRETVRAAILRLGLGATRKVILRHLAAALFPPIQGGRLDRNTFVKHAFACAEMAEALAKAGSGTCVHDAYAAGLFHDIGKLALDRAVPEGYSRTLDVGSAQGLSVLEAERRELGADHMLAGKWLAERWGFPPRLVAAIWLHHQPLNTLDPSGYPRDLIDLVALADALVRGAGGNLTRSAEERARRLGIAAETLKALAAKGAGDAAPKLEAATTPAATLTGAAGRDWPMLLRHEKHYRALRSLFLGLDPNQDRATVLTSIAAAVRQAFDVPAGGCFVADEEGGCLEGAVWHSADREPEFTAIPFDKLRDASQQASNSALLELLRGMVPGGQQAAWALVRRHGLIAVPMPVGGDSAGQMVLDATATALRSDPEALSELLDFSRVCGLALAYGRDRIRLGEQSEAWATALSRQEFAHRQQVRHERMASVAKLAAGAAHEINNPLTVISGRAQILLSHTYSQEDVRALETIIQQSRRVTKILSDLMQFARPPEPRLEATVVSFILHQVAAMLRERLEGKGIDIAEDYTPGLPRVRLDRHQMGQALLNLIVNAEQAMEDKGGTLTLRARTSQDHRSVIVQVVDTGRGIPAGVIDKVFEPFFTTREQAAATGLGLSVCHGIIENHRGAITVHSTVGEGTTCTITLPAAVAAVPAAEEAPAAAPAAVRTIKPQSGPAAERPKTRPTILVVDDDEDLRQVLGETLRNRGFLIRTAADGLEAMATVMGHRVDLVLLEWSLASGEAGTSLLRQLRQRYPNLPLIAITGVTTDEDAHEALRQGARACLRKPFEMAQLLGATQQALGSRNVA